MTKKRGTSTPIDKGENQGKDPKDPKNLKDTKDNKSDEGVNASGEGDTTTPTPAETPKTSEGNGARNYNLLLAVTHNKTVVILRADVELSRAPKITLPKEIQDRLVPGYIFYAKADIQTKKVMEVPTTEIGSIVVVGIGEIK